MGKRSVTLVEIIVSMSILGLVLLGIAGIFIAGKGYLKRAQYKQEALNFGREKLEELEACDFDDDDCLSSGSDTLSNGWLRTWTIIDVDEDLEPIVTSDPDRKKITVTVEWQEP